jgi:hypothetical protein
MNRYTRFLLLAIPVGLGLSVLLEGVVQILPPFHSPLIETESALALGPFGLLESLSLLARAAMTFALLGAFARIVPLQARWSGGHLLLGTSAAAKVLLALVATDLSPRPETAHGLVHALAAMVSFVLGALGQLLIARMVRGGFGGGPLSRLLVSLGWASCIGAVVLIGTVPFSARIGVWGLLERGETAVGLLWTLTAALALWRRSSGGAAQTTSRLRCAP